MSSEAVFEVWLDAWCVMWHHIGSMHAEVGTSGCGQWALKWYQCGVMMGTLGLSLKETIAEAHDDEMCAQAFAAYDPDDPGVPL